MSDPKRKKKKKGALEATIMALIHKSLKTTIDEAMKEIFKDFKQKAAACSESGRAAVIFRLSPSDGEGIVLSRRDATTVIRNQKALGKLPWPCLSVFVFRGSWCP